MYQAGKVSCSAPGWIWAAGLEYDSPSAPGPNSLLTCRMSFGRGRVRRDAFAGPGSAARAYIFNDGASMSQTEKSGRITAGERMTARILQWAPWLAFFVVALPVPLYFLFKYFASSTDSALNFLFALTSLAVGSVIGFAVTLFLLYYR